MDLEKNELITLISIIYKSETYFKELENSYLENIESVENLNSTLSQLEERIKASKGKALKLKGTLEEKESENQGIEEHIQEVNRIIEEQRRDDIEFNKLKNSIHETNISVIESYKELKQLKSGNETFFNWRFLSLSDKKKIDTTINNQEFSEWLNFNLNNEQKLIFSKIDVKKIESLLSDDIDEKSNLLMELRELDDILFFMSALFGFNGKETVYLYLRKEDKESVIKCNNEDIVKNSLLNTFEEVDLSLLNKITKENDLTRLYLIADKEASKIDVNYSNKKKINELSEQVKNLLNRRD